MTDENRPAAKYHRQALEHLGAVHARRMAVQAQTARWDPNGPQEPAGTPTPPPTEEDE